MKKISVFLTVQINELNNEFSIGIKEIRQKAVSPPLAGFLLEVGAKIAKKIFTGIKQRKSEKNKRRVKELCYF